MTSTTNLNKIESIFTQAMVPTVIYYGNFYPHTEQVEIMKDFLNLPVGLSESQTDYIISYVIKFLHRNQVKNTNDIMFEQMNITDTCPFCCAVFEDDFCEELVSPFLSKHFGESECVNFEKCKLYIYNILTTMFKKYMKKQIKKYRCEKIKFLETVKNISRENVEDTGLFSEQVKEKVASKTSHSMLDTIAFNDNSNTVHTCPYCYKKFSSFINEGIFYCMFDLHLKSCSAFLKCVEHLTMTYEENNYNGDTLVDIGYGDFACKTRLVVSEHSRGKKLPKEKRPQVKPGQKKLLKLKQKDTEKKEQYYLARDRKSKNYFLYC